MKHLIDPTDLSLKEIDEILDLAEDIIDVYKRQHQNTNPSFEHILKRER